MKNSRSRVLRNRKKRIQRRLAPRSWTEQAKPMLGRGKITYEMAEKTRAIKCAGVGVALQLCDAVGLRDLIDDQLQLLKRHSPYHESDHVLSIALNLLAGGTCLDDLELLRNDENYLDAVGAQRIPDPTTAGDFCRRFKSREDIEALFDAFNKVRVELWKRQGRRFFGEAILDVDATTVETMGECKEGADFSHDGKYGYRALVITLANTGEVLHLSLSGANRPSHEGAAEAIEEVTALCRAAGFREVTVRGDTDYSLTQRFDQWHRDGNRFVVGYDAKKNLVQRSQDLAEGDWCTLERTQKRQVKTEPRARPTNERQRVVEAREFKNFTLEKEHVAEFDYQPGACALKYRMIALRKTISVKEGQALLFNEVRYFFYVTNDRIAPAESIVFDANDRCNQENLIAHLKAAGILHAPVDGLLSNWAYMVIASLAWSLKAWIALALPDGGRWAETRRAEKTTLLRMEFRTFLNAMMLIPAQIVRTGRRIVYRVLTYTRWVPVFFRATNSLAALRC